MKELVMLILLVVIGGLAYAFFLGHSHSVNFHYNCGVAVPWYDAIFLDTNHCPNLADQK